MSDTSNLIFMNDQQGEPTYLLFAVRGKIGLQIKHNAIIHGFKYGLNDTMLISSTVRSTKLTTDMPAQDVVNIADKKLTITDAWPNIKWGKVDTSRASTVISAPIAGVLGGPAKLQEQFLGEMANAKVAKKLANYLAKLVGEQYLIITEQQLAEYFDKLYTEDIESSLNSVEINKAMIHAQAQNMGHFAMQAELLAQVYKTKNIEISEPETPSAEDPDESEEDPNAAPDA